MPNLTEKRDDSKGDAFPFKQTHGQAILQMSASKGGKNCEHNEKTLKLLKKGDIIFVSRWGYWHYGVFKGGQGDSVIHLTGYLSIRHCTCHEIKPDTDTGICTICKKKITYFVREGNFYDVCSKGKAYKLEDGGRKPRKPDEIVKMAESMIGPAFYNMKFANCEHFATTCRYEVGFSTQTKTLGIIHMGTTYAVKGTESNKLEQTTNFHPVLAVAEYFLAERKGFHVENEAVLKEVRTGDIILISRPGFWHYGVSIGNEYVIHLTGYNWDDPCKCPKLEKSEKEGFCKTCNRKVTHFIRKSTLWDFTAKGVAQIIKDEDRRSDSSTWFTSHLEVDEIVRNAKSMLGPAVFDKKNANCEHFATMCRYGTGFSTQTKVYDVIYRGHSWEFKDKTKQAKKK
ncbi:hypothetical protein BsWGS_17139 [Bradybaena similaris]